MPGPTGRCFFCGRFMIRHKRESLPDGTVTKAGDECTNPGCFENYKPGEDAIVYELDKEGNLVRTLSKSGSVRIRGTHTRDRRMSKWS